MIVWDQMEMERMLGVNDHDPLKVYKLGRRKSACIGDMRSWNCFLISYVILVLIGLISRQYSEIHAKKHIFRSYERQHIH